MRVYNEPTYLKNKSPALRRRVARAADRYIERGEVTKARETVIAGHLLSQMPGDDLEQMKRLAGRKASLGRFLPEEPHLLVKAAIGVGALAAGWAGYRHFGIWGAVGGMVGGTITSGIVACIAAEEIFDNVIQSAQSELETLKQAEALLEGTPTPPTPPETASVAEEPTIEELLAQARLQDSPYHRRLRQQLSADRHLLEGSGHLTPSEFRERLAPAGLWRSHGDKLKWPVSLGVGLASAVAIHKYCGDPTAAVLAGLTGLSAAIAVSKLWAPGGRYTEDRLAAQPLHNALDRLEFAARPAHQAPPRASFPGYWKRLEEAMLSAPIEEVESLERIRQNLEAMSPRISLAEACLDLPRGDRQVLSSALKRATGELTPVDVEMQEDEVKVGDFNLEVK